MSDANRIDAIAKDIGFTADWRDGILDRQRLTVAVLQNRLRAEVIDRNMRTTRSPTGELKDLAVALGIAVDKLAVIENLAT